MSVRRFPYLLLTLRSKSVSSNNIRRSPDVRNRTRDITYRLRALSETLKKLATIIKDEHKAFKVLNRSSGLTSLPDDLLAMIFDYVVNKDKNKCLIPIRWRVAVKLISCLSAFPQHLAILSRLWTTMNRSTQMVAACLPRAKSVPLAVDITVYPNTDAGGWYFEPVLTELLPHSKRWGHLAINFDLGCSNLPLQDDFLDKSTVEKLRHLDASLLEELCIQNDEWDGAGRCHWDWSHWKHPQTPTYRDHFLFPSFSSRVMPMFQASFLCFPSNSCLYPEYF